MFIRWRTRKLNANGSKRWGAISYRAYLIEGFRLGEKSKQRTVAYLGSFQYRNGFNRSKGHFERKVEFLRDIAEKTMWLNLTDDQKCSIKERLLKYIESIEYSPEEITDGEK